jgi:uncharacterized RDD family membrane protein YckC
MAATPAPSKRGQYAGAVSRAAAYLVDFGVSFLVFSIVSAASLFLLDRILQTNLSQNSGPEWLWTTLLALWLLLYYGGSWSVAGKTPGMATLGLRVVARDGGPLPRWRGVLRAPALALSFATFGLGFVGIVIGREHRGLQDVIAGSVVVYDWDARVPQPGFLQPSRPPPRHDQTGVITRSG